jgi:hypothetical protein
MKLPLDKIRLEAGVVVGPWSDRWINYKKSGWLALTVDDRRDQKDRVGKGMPLALELRLVSPIFKPFVYWTASFEPGVLLYRNYKYDAAQLADPTNDYGFGYNKTLDSGTHAIFLMNLRVGLSFYFVDWLEIRVDPLGMGLHCTKPFGVVWTPSFALVLRI